MLVVKTNSKKAKKGTEVSTPMVTKGSDHSGPSVTNKILSNDMALQSKTDKIITNSQALSEEISNMRYLIEYMNNNNNNKNKIYNYAINL
jgi:hypothetical protein